MAKFDDSLRGYAFEIHRRDGFTCQFCGLDCSTWPLWLWLSVDHLLPKGHPRREEPSFKVTACMFCNTADNRYLEKSNRTGTDWDSLNPEMLVERRRASVEKTRASYKHFWEQHVNPARPARDVQIPQPTTPTPTDAELADLALTREQHTHLARPFDEATWRQATAIVLRYSLVISPDEELVFFGRTLELPLVMSDGATIEACARSTLEATACAVATILEAGDTPPVPEHDGRRADSPNPPPR